MSTNSTLSEIGRTLYAIERAVDRITEYTREAEQETGILPKNALMIAALHDASKQLLSSVYLKLASVARDLPEFRKGFGTEQLDALCVHIERIRAISADRPLRGLVGDPAVSLHLHFKDAFEAYDFAVKSITQITENMETYMRYVSIWVTPKELEAEALRIIEDACQKKK